MCICWFVIFRGTLLEGLYAFIIISHSVLLRMRSVVDISVVDISRRDNHNTRFIFSNFFSKNRTVFEIMLRNAVDPDGPQMT
jgi:hypothetical protein